jgi:hypothetical protein
LTATESSPPRAARSLPIGTIVLLAVSIGLYLWLMASITGPLGGSGEALMGRALEALFVTFFLWIALAALLVAGGVMGEMPRWAAILAVVAHPLSGVGAFVAIDMMSRNAAGAIVVPALLPLLLGFYAMWARFPAWRTVFPAPITGIVVWAAILVLAIAPMPISYWGPGTFGQ